MANYLCPPVVKEREMVLFWSGGARVRETHLGGCILCIVTVSAVYRLFTWSSAPSLDISENINYDWDQPAAAALSPWADHLTVWQVAPRPLTSPPNLLKIPFYYPLLQDQWTQQNNRGIYHANESIMVTSGRGHKGWGRWLQGNSDRSDICK